LESVPMPRHTLSLSSKSLFAFDNADVTHECFVCCSHQRFRHRICRSSVLERFQAGFESLQIRFTYCWRPFMEQDFSRTGDRIDWFVSFANTRK
jgi:hypothetical protein